ncbi:MULTISPECIES: cytochrome c oxidase subunit I [Methylosinus]|uniref:cytochrome-c oxidase n=1 Tax=Methylosinus trichosporium (strain ATCC 35070 / NCIMB 11131 / UNIQEM 75 / OB3b) TaxID=595536 RepID=A0A2D2D137_METT3|nr:MULTISPECIES: cytochrome c oxidase subunit I [Methylosinus]ATQ68700.1 cytochrome c oxidase subunit I [Methylosinus trichosporium OB3b]OBS53140.1 cytochrome c oxidase subunit I [Methylosinus sp. 3S-1]
MKSLARHRALTLIWASEPGWRGFFTTVNHSDLGRMFLVVAVCFFLVAGVLAMLIRAQLATAHSAFLRPGVYDQIFTMHGTLMMFLFAIPLFEGAAVYLLPKLLGTRDLAFPRLSAYGFWCYVLGAAMLVFALLAGLAPNSGWFMYPPLSSIAHSPGVNSDFWLVGVTFVEISAIAAAVEIAVSVLKFRAPGMSLDRMPIFAWYALATALMMIMGFPPLILGSILLELERAFGLPFFEPGLGGDPLLWQHLFWLFGHPEVYIIFLPAAGVVSTVLPAMARTTLLGYRAVVAAVFALAFLSFGLWVHHMFATGIPFMALGFFAAASTLVAVPTAVQIFAWIGTLWNGRPRLTLPMLYILGFFFTFVIGGLTGVMVAIVPFDWQAHDTAFVTAHLHYVLMGGFVLPMLAGLYYWLPHFTGRKRFFRIGEMAFWLIFIGFNGTFLAMHWVGLLGQRRRIDTYAEDTGFGPINLFSSICGFILSIGFAMVLIDVVLHVLLAIRGSRNPWKAGTLEWAMPTPPAAYNFASIPQVRSREPLAADPRLAVAIARGEFYLGEPRHNLRETLMVDASSGRPEALVIFPGNTMLPFLLAVATGAAFLGVLIKAYWLVPIALVAMTALALRWSSSLGERADLGPQEVGCGASLPRSAEIDHSPGWWGSVFLLSADAVFFGSLLFGYAFLWTIAPGWPPPRWLSPSILGLLLGAIGVAASFTGIRFAARANRRGASSSGGLVLSLLGAVAMLAALAILVARTLTLLDHAYGATIFVIGAYALAHVALVILMTSFLIARVRRGYTSPARRSGFAILRLWTDYGAFVAALALAVTSLPGLAA